MAVVYIIYILQVWSCPSVMCRQTQSSDGFSPGNVFGRLPGIWPSSQNRSFAGVTKMLDIDAGRLEIF